MTITGTTVYTTELMKEYGRFYLVKSPWRILAFCLLECVMLLIAAHLIVVAAATRRAGDAVFAAFFACFFGLFEPVMLLIAPQRTARRSKKVIGASNRYEFSGDGIVIESSQAGANGNSRADYSYLDRVYEDKRNFYFYLTKRQACILRKADLAEGDAAALRALLKEHLPPKKYIVRCK